MSYHSRRCALRVEGLITNRSTRQTDWTEAHLVAIQWETWGQTTEPLTNEYVTPRKAVDEFLKSKGPFGEKLDDSTMRGYRVILEQRLLPFCEKHSIGPIEDFANNTVVLNFKTSWRNLSADDDQTPLSATTQNGSTDQLRTFLSFCKTHGYIKGIPNNRLTTN